MVFDTGSDNDAHALDRLAQEKMAWLTTVTPDGQPQTFPVWFLWERGEILVFSDYRAKRNANIAANPRVVLHLNDDGEGRDVVVVEGVARVDDGTPVLEEHAAYLAKYGEWITRDLGSVERMAAVYNVPIRISPTRGRATGA
jgi:PPOX class probable F420-dependent enzyme